MSITPFFHVYHKYVFNMDNISKIKISGTSYSIKDENACKVVELTQAQYDDLPTTAKTSNSLFVITDAQGADLSNYYTKTETDGLLDTKLDVTAYTPTDLSNYYTKSETSGATEISTALASKADTATTYTKTETDNAITAATSTKQDTLVSGTNIKTINNQSILGEGNITIEGGGGGSITIDPSLDSGSTNAVANSAITNAINDRQLKREYVGSNAVFENSDVVRGRTIYNPMFRCYSNNSTNTELVLNNKDLGLYFPSFNGKKIFSTNKNETDWLGDVIEASAITTSISSSSTDIQVPSAKAVYDQLGGLKLVKLTQSEYDSLTTKDNSILYVIVN